jgi:hypothetical protein
MASLQNSLKAEKSQLKSTQKNIDKAYKQALGVYDTQLSQIQQLQPEYEQMITQGYESQRPILQQQFDLGTANIGAQREQVGQTRETALSSARRQYEQGLQRSQQLFGGVGGSSTGQASSELLGAETARTMGQARMQSAQNMQQLSTAERDLQSQLTNQLQQLEVKKTQDIMKARDLFRQEINQINTQRANIGLNKATSQLQALQDYNQRKRNLEDYYVQQTNTLAQYQRELKDTRETYMMQQNYNNSLNNTTKFSPMQTNFKSYGYGNDVARGAIINQLMATNPGQKQLFDLGYDVFGDFIQNRNTGETYNRFGKRYKDFGVRDKLEQKLDYVPEGQNE